MMMLKGAIICPDEEMGSRLEELLGQMGVVAVVRRLDKYPNAHELTRMLRSSAPQVLFLGIESHSRAMEVVVAAEEQLPGVQVIAVGRDADPQTLLDVMRSGIREFIAPPFQRQLVHDSLVRVKEILDRRPVQFDSTDLLFSFLPSKPGVGATTIAVNTALALSRIPDQRSLLLDCDLNSGMIRFLLQLENSYSIMDAVERATQIDENIWPQLITLIGHLDVIHSGRLNPDLRVEPTHVRQILDYARRSYKSVLLDLSGNFEKFSIEAMHESKRVFLVVTPEVPSLHLAREKMAYLKNLGLLDRVYILVNRAHKRSVVSAAQIQDLLGRPVTLTFANDYQRVQLALNAAKSVDSSTELGCQYAELARLLLDRKQQPSPDSKRKISEFFSLPSTASLFSKKTV